MQFNNGTWMPEAATSRSKYINGLQNGRGLAALVVVLFHSYGFVELIYGLVFSRKLFQAGHSGVEFFFVLSGFIIFTVHSGDFGHPHKLRSFILKRIARIYPMFWIVAVPLGIWLMLKPISINSLNLFDFIKDILLIPREGNLILNPAWSLQHEMIFYLVFGLAILSRRLGLWVLIAWQVSCLTVLITFGPQNYASAFSKLFGYYNFGFVFGILAAIVYRSSRFSFHAPYLRITGIISTLLLICMFLGEWHSGVTWLGGGAVTTTIYFTLYTMIILASLTIQRRFRFMDAALGALGNASYTIYLTHLPIAGATIKILHFFDLATLINPTALYLIIVSTCVLAGLVMHHLIEAPLQTYLKSKFGERPDRTPLAKKSADHASATG